MAKIIKNDRCPFRDECEKKCTYQNHENDCAYYLANATNVNHIDDQWDEADIDYSVIDNFDDSDDKAKLVYIPIENLFPHPDNPRKELGDLTELADSIRAKGIMQNLTVVPKDKDTYTVVIGHRRLGASKIAGLSELPCVIADMSPKEQISTMATENMQRSDLTIYEEACCMQMMLDFGDSLENVSEQTGLSKTTIRRRVKLLEFDESTLKRSLERGATIMDYEKLDKIKSVELKNKVLDALGTQNFEWELKKALQSEQSDEREQHIYEILNSFAEPKEDIRSLKYVEFIPLTGNGEVDVPADSDTVQYYYHKNENGTWIGLYRDKTEEDLSDENERNEKRIKQDRINALASDIAKRAFELRKEFIKTAYISSKEQTEELIKFAFASIYQNQTNYMIVTDNTFCEYAGLGTDETGSTIQDIISGNFGMKPQRALLIIAYSNYHDSENMKYTDHSNKHKVNEKLETIYNFLEKLGYECSDEENAWREGTHEIYSMNEGNSDES